MSYGGDVTHTDLLESEIRNLGAFVYRANGGNLGDSLLSSAEFDYFERMGLRYTQASSKNKSLLISKPFNLVYGGGGGWISCYSKGYQQPMNEYFRNSHLKRCVVLPSTFYECDDVVRSFDDRFVVFCRDKMSMEYCRSVNSRAKFVFHDDMAFSLDASRFLDERYFLRKHEVVLGPSCKKAKEYIDSNHGRHAMFIRSDAEMSVSPGKGNFDLSAVFYRHGEHVTRAESDDATALMLNTVNVYDSVSTNRLHVAIAALLLGKHIDLYDNSYGKVSRVYASSPAMNGSSNISVHF